MYNSTRVRRGVLVALLVAGLSPPVVCSAEGEIYMSRDAHGNVIFTNTPTGDEWKRVGREPAPINPYLNYDEQEKKFDKIILYYAKKNRLDPYLVKGMMKVESHFDPDAVSAAGAHGLLQLMPKTGERYGVTDLFDPQQNIKGATRYLRDLSLMFGGDTRLIVAAYNCGEDLVIRTRAVPDIPETQGYVRAVLEARDHYKKVGFAGDGLTTR